MCAGFSSPVTAAKAMRSASVTVRLRRALGANAPVTVDSVQDDPVLQRFRAVTVDMQDEEHRLLRERNADMAMHNHRSRIALILGSALALLIVVASVWRVMRDSAEREKAEESLRALNRLYAMVGGINALTVRVHDRDALFKSSCQIAVEHGEFEMAWIGVIDRVAKKIVPLAWAGAEEQRMDVIRSFFASNGGDLDSDSMAARAIVSWLSMSNGATRARARARASRSAVESPGRTRR